MVQKTRILLDSFWNDWDGIVSGEIEVLKDVHRSTGKHREAQRGVRLKPFHFTRAGFYNVYPVTVSAPARMCPSPLQSCAKIMDWLDSLSGLATVTRRLRWLTLLLPMEKALSEPVCPENASGFPEAWPF